MKIKRKLKDMTNQIVTKDFLKATSDIIAENTSLNYSIIAIRGIKAQLEKEFKFLRCISIMEHSIEVSEDINSVSNDKIKEFFSRAINSIGPSYLKMLLAQRLPPNELAYLKNLGLGFG